MNSCIYAGSFDPITNGHIDIIERSLKIFDVVWVAILNNPDKKYMFTNSERQQMIYGSLFYIDDLFNKVQVFSSNELLVNMMKQLEIKTSIRGIRNYNDLIYEQQMEYVNKKLYNEMETIYLMPNDKNINISSSMVRQLINLNVDIQEFVPYYVKHMVHKQRKEKGIIV